ncbi:hypothetical protein J2Z21_008309 [Streptomyces griseochromogenes]|uniref:Uncharacterized protein n=1 Tax=Streptomyces griseochromogenes TaxID=68214 RepID=A0ABS4M6M2_9ACTN|nr:hypothetical protein [Streptomyces griseochromogenes]MBP2055295.1 hypothetical protein [Streptomyces griseochromogenes]
MSLWKSRRPAAVRVLTGTVLAAALLAPAATAAAATPAVHGAAAPVAAAAAASPVRTQTLADGSTAEIYKLGAEHYLAKIVYRGQVYGTLEANQHDTGVDANDMFVVLTLDGQVHSWLGGGHRGPGTFALPGGWTARVTKVGAERYRAQILGDRGVVYGTLETNGHDTGVNANGVFIVLSLGGVISAHL